MRDSTSVLSKQSQTAFSQLQKVVCLSENPYVNEGRLLNYSYNATKKTYKDRLISTIENIKDEIEASKNIPKAPFKQLDGHNIKNTFYSQLIDFKFGSNLACAIGLLLKRQESIYI